ncbi:MAG: IS3 family transposase [Gemmatimonadaceae bacterium]
MSAKYADIAAHRDEFPVSLMCRVLGVSPAGFYAAQRRPPSARAQATAQLRVLVRATHAQSRKRYGAPRIHEALQQRQVRVSRKRIARVMQEEALVGRMRRRFVVTTDSAHADPIAPHKLRRDFAVGKQRAINRRWVSDVTYIPTRTGWLYLAIILDVTSRRIVGWATSARNDATLVVTALRRALALRQPKKGWMLHSDRGSVYASDAFRTCVRRHRGVASMSRRANCWDNAVAESFFATLEWELLDDTVFASHHAARRALVEFIDRWYNHERLHSTLGYQSPAQFEQALSRTRRAA